MNRRRQITIRILLTLIVCLVVGAIAQTVVAWCCAAYTPFVGGAMQQRYLHYQQSDDAVAASVQWWHETAPEDVYLDPLYADFRYQRARDFWAIYGTHSYQPYGHFLYRVEAGWPMRSLAGAVWLERDYLLWEELFNESVRSASFNAGDADMDLPPSAQITRHGAFLTRFDTLTPTIVPYTPLVIGFAVNTCVFAITALLFLFLFQTARSIVREQRNRQVRCIARFVLLSVVCIIVGGVAQACVAYFSASTTLPNEMPWADQFIASRDDVKWWRTHAPSDFPDEPSYSYVLRNSWMRSRQMSWTPDPITGMSTLHDSVYFTESGWPFYSLTGIAWQATDHDWEGHQEHRKQLSSAAFDGTSLPPPFQHPERWIFEGTDEAIFGTAGPLSSQFPMIKPRRPIPIGFALNTVLYAMTLWVLMFLPVALRRCVRSLRGRCLSCGYDLRATTTWRCPECGTVTAIARGADSRRLPDCW